MVVLCLKKYLLTQFMFLLELELELGVLDYNVMDKIFPEIYLISTKYAILFYLSINYS